METLKDDSIPDIKVPPIFQSTNLHRRPDQHRCKHKAYYYILKRNVICPNCYRRDFCGNTLVGCKDTKRILIVCLICDIYRRHDLKKMKFCDNAELCERIFKDANHRLTLDQLMWNFRFYNYCDSYQYFDEAKQSWTIHLMNDTSRKMLKEWIIFRLMGDFGRFQIVYAKWRIQIGDIRLDASRVAWGIRWTFYNFDKNKETIDFKRLLGVSLDIFKGAIDKQYKLIADINSLSEEIYDLKVVAFKDKNIYGHQILGKFFAKCMRVDRIGSTYRKQPLGEFKEYPPKKDTTSIKEKKVLPEVIIVGKKSKSIAP